MSMDAAVGCVEICFTHVNAFERVAVTKRVDAVNESRESMAVTASVEEMLLCANVAAHA